jgi:hypothetical protein
MKLRSVHVRKKQRKQAADAKRKAKLAPLPIKKK